MNTTSGQTWKNLVKLATLFGKAVRDGDGAAARDMGYAHSGAFRLGRASGLSLDELALIQPDYCGGYGGDNPCDDGNPCTADSCGATARAAPIAERA